MSIKSKLAIIGLSTAVALFTVVGGFMSNRNSVFAKGDPYVQLKIFSEVLKHVVRDYVDEPDMEKVRVGALRGLADGLDPYSAYLTRDQVARFNAETLNRNASGAVFSKVGGFLYVVSVLKGSPAEAAGLRGGDFIEYVGQVATRDVSLYDIQETIGALPNSQAVEFTVLRRGRSEKIKIKAAAFEQPAVESRIEDGEVGYVKVTSLASGKAAEVKQAVNSLVGKGAKKIVLDLRGAAGGSLDEGVAVANLFVKSGPLARTVGHQGKVLKSFEASENGFVFGGPLVVLINRTTAGPAEIIPAAVAFGQRGDVVGEKTFGAGSEQELFRLQDGAGIYMTTVKYAPATGKPFMEEPVAPTVEVKSSLVAEVPPDDDDDDSSAPRNSQAPNNSPGKDQNESERKQPATNRPEDVQLKKALELLKPAVKTEKKAA